MSESAEWRRKWRGGVEWRSGVEEKSGVEERTSEMEWRTVE